MLGHKDLELFRNRFYSMLIDLQKSEDFDQQLNDTSSGDDMDKLQAGRENVLYLQLKGRESQLIKKVHNALDKLDDGIFGFCEDCGAEISLNRLMARPMADLCIHCKEKSEREQEHLTYERRSHTHGREIVNNNIINVSFGEREETKENIIPFL